MGRNKVTPRVVQDYDLRDALGCKFSTNLSATCRAQFIGVENDLAYFKTVPHESWEKYNNCAGQVFWIPLRTAICMQPMEWCCDIELDN